MSIPRQRGLTEQAATAAIDQACRMLRLPTIRSQFPELGEATFWDMVGAAQPQRQVPILACCPDTGTERCAARSTQPAQQGSSRARLRAPAV